MKYLNARSSKKNAGHSNPFRFIFLFFPFLVDDAPRLGEGCIGRKQERGTS